MPSDVKNFEKIYLDILESLALWMSNSEIPSYKTASEIFGLKGKDELLLLHHCDRWLAGEILEFSINEFKVALFNNLGIYKRNKERIERFSFLLAGQ